MRALEVLAKPALVPAPPMQPPGQAMPSIMQFLILPALARVRTFFAFGKAFCVFDVYGYVGVVFFQAVFDGSGYTACDGISSSCGGCGLGFFRGVLRRWMG